MASERCTKCDTILDNYDPSGTLCKSCDTQPPEWAVRAAAHCANANAARIIADASPVRELCEALEHVSKCLRQLPLHKTSWRESAMARDVEGLAEYAEAALRKAGKL